MPVKPPELAEEIAAILRQRPYFYSELLRKYAQVDYRTFLLGWSELRTKYSLARDEEGRYLMEK